MTVATCSSCRPHAFQDKKYGPGRRVMNPCKNGDALRCTVCGSERSVGGTDTPRKSKKSA